MSIFICLFIYLFILLISVILVPDYLCELVCLFKQNRIWVMQKGEIGTYLADLLE